MAIKLRVFIILTLLALYNTSKLTINNEKLQSKLSNTRSLIDLIKTTSGKNYNENSFYLNNMLDYTIEYYKTNTSKFYRKLDKNILQFEILNYNNQHSLQQQQQQQQYDDLISSQIGYSSLFQQNSNNLVDKEKNINEQSDIYLKFNSNLLSTNQIYKIILCCQHNIVGYALTLNEKKYNAIALTSNSRFTEVFFLENEKNIKIKSNVLTMPIYNLFNNNNNNVEKVFDIDNKNQQVEFINDNKNIQFKKSHLNNINNNVKHRNKNLYYLNSLLISDIVTKDGDPWKNLFIKIQICPSKYKFLSLKMLFLINKFNCF